MNGESIRVESRGDSVWWKDICNIDFGEVGSSSLYSVKEVYKGLMANVSSCSDHI